MPVSLGRAFRVRIASTRRWPSPARRAGIRVDEPELFGGAGAIFLFDKKTRYQGSCSVLLSAWPGNLMLIIGDNVVITGQ